MAYDTALADRVRDLLAADPLSGEVTERKMFGGLAFLVGGRMALAVSRQGGLLVRVDPKQSDALVARTGAELAVMQGRQMDGWLRVTADRLRTGRQVSAWVSRAVRYVDTLPAPTAKQKR